MTDRRGRGAAVATAALVVLVGVTASGCAGSDPPPDPPPATTAVGPATAPPTTQDRTADEALAAEALLSTAEVPGGPWREGDARPDTAASGLRCDTMPTESAYFDEHARDAPGARSPELGDPTNTVTVQLDVKIVASIDVAETVGASFADERWGACLEDRFLRDAAMASGTVTAAAVRPLEVDTVGDSSSVWSVALTVEQGSETVEVAGVIALVRVGRGFATVQLLGSPALGAGDIEPILGAAAAKLAATVG